MKKTICLLLAVLALCSLGACDLFGKQPVEENVSETEVKEVEFGRGVWDGDVYKNEFAGLTYEKPADWTTKSDEDMAELIGISVDALYDDNKYIEAIINKANVYDMYAIDAYGVDSVMVVFENVELTGGKDMSESEYLETVGTQLEAQNLGYTIGDISTTIVGNKRYTRLETTNNSNGLSISQNYYVRRADKYMIDIIATSFSVDADELMSSFK